MIEFAQKIDMRSRKKMTEYLKNHFRYFTANSWNRSTSYACNLKIYKLGLSREIENKLYEMTESQEFLIIFVICWTNLTSSIIITGRQE